MGLGEFLFGSTKWHENPNARAGFEGLEQWAGGLKLNPYSKLVKKAINSGDYSRMPAVQLAQSMGAVNQRMMSRDLAMGGNAMFGSAQPALMAALGQSGRLANADQTAMQGMAGMQGDVALFQADRENRRMNQRGALESALQGRLGSGQFIQKQGQLGNMIGMAAGAFLPGLGALGGTAGRIGGAISRGPRIGSGF